MMALPSPDQVAAWLHAFTVNPLQLGALIALATLVSEDLACIAAGLLAARGDLSLPAAILAALIGIVVGDLLLYIAGRAAGPAVLRRRPWSRWISPNRVERARVGLSRWGGPALVGARFVPGLRLPTYVAAGVVAMDAVTFTLWITLGAALWTPLLVAAAAGSGSAIHGLGPWPLVGAVLSLLAALWLVRSWIVPLFSWRGRRLLLGRVRRLRRWEFWPIWWFNIPVVVYFFWLALRHRSLSLFTAANPAIPSGGLVRESKAAILEGLSAGGPAPKVAHFRLLLAVQTAEARLATVESFLSEYRLDFPVVLKPDVGQRGEGVRIVYRAEDLALVLAEQNGDAIVQEYIPGVEFGLFYLRFPHQDITPGRLFSITRKRLLALVGDGRSTLEQLILTDDRAVCMAPLHLERHADALETIPAAGQRVDLVELGNHCRGAVFLDGSDLATPELAAALDTLSRGYEGFYFGRFDVRTASEEALRAGEFRVLELNGVASEATHIYDPKTPLLEGYRVLFEQWRHAFAIGAENRARGHAPMPLGELLSEVFAFLRPAAGKS
ncbi:MAG: VTT domain-containing protein [Acidobacteriota bacterium]